MYLILKYHSIYVYFQFTRLCVGDGGGQRPPPPTHTQTYPRFYVPLICCRVFSKEFWQDVKQSVKMSITQRYPQTQSSPSPPPPPSSLLWFVSCPSLFLNTQSTLWKWYSKYHPFLELWYEIYQYHPWCCFIFLMIFTIHGFFWEKKKPSGSKNIRTAFHCRLPCFIWHRTNGPC